VPKSTHESPHITARSLYGALSNEQKNAVDGQPQNIMPLPRLSVVKGIKTKSRFGCLLRPGNGTGPIHKEVNK